MNTQIRWMIKRDMVEVLDIERASFDEASHWTEDDFCNCLRQHNCMGMVVEEDGRVIGYMIYELRKASLLILNFAVAPPFRRMGVGTQMVEKLVNKLSQQRRQEITLGVRETNLRAQRFFHACGFMATEVLREHFSDSKEDAYRMRLGLPGNDDRRVARRTNRVSAYFEGAD